MVNIEKIKNEFIEDLNLTIIMGVFDEIMLINSIVEFDNDVEDVIRENLKIEVKKEEIRKQQQSLNKLFKEIQISLQNLRLSEVEKMRNNGKLLYHLNTLNKSELNDLLRMGLVRSEEVSKISLRRWNDNQNNHIKNYNEIPHTNTLWSMKS